MLIILGKTADIILVNASELLTLQGPPHPRRGPEMKNIGIIKDGAVAVKNGKIIAVGQTHEILNNFKAAPSKIIDATNKIIMPGFVDAHTHLVFAGSREHEFLMKLEGKSYIDILNAGGGILSTVKSTRKAAASELITLANKRLDDMLRLGTTTVEIKTGYGLTTTDELKSLEVINKLQARHHLDIVSTFLAAHAVPPEMKNADEYIDMIIKDMLPKVVGKAKYCDVFCEEGVFSIEQSRKLLKAAREKGLELKLHADEFVDSGGAGLAAELKTVSAEHLLCSNMTNIKKMADNNVIGVLLPVSAFSMMKGIYANARKMIEIGLPIAFGTDLCPNSWTESMQFVNQLACHNMKMTPAETITSSTINAAYAIGLADNVGSIEVGKQADLLVVGIPNHIHLAYHLGINHVERVIKNGKIII